MNASKPPEELLAGEGVIYANSPAVEYTAEERPVVLGDAYDLRVGSIEGLRVILHQTNKNANSQSRVPENMDEALDEL